MSLFETVGMTSEKVSVLKGKISNDGKGKRYTYDEDIAILNYMLTNNRYLRASGIHIWKEAEKIGICPGRPYLSMKERFRKTIVKNLKDYKIDKARIMEVTEFMRANKEGKKTLQLKKSSLTHK